jgi:hypothetical protein
MRYGPHERVREGTVLSLRIVTGSVVFLTLAAGSAWAQTATTTTPGKPLQLFQIIQQSDGSAVRVHHRSRYVKRKAAGTRVANQTIGATRHEYMQAQPAPEPQQAEATPPAATTTVPANIWPAPDVTLPGMQAQSPMPSAAPIAASNKPATAANQNDMLTAAYDAVQVTPASAAQPIATDPAQITSPSRPQVTPPNTVQIAQVNTASVTDGGADEPREATGTATNTAKTSNPVMSWPAQRAIVASAELENPNPVGSVSWIVHVLAALGATIAAGALAWVLINPLPARSYE